MDSKPNKAALNLSVIVPVFNEAPTIVEILGRVRSLKIDDVEVKIIVVDDGSTDGTLELLEANAGLYDVLLKNPVNLGKGGAVKNGLTAAKGDYVLFQDGDLEYDPAEYIQLLTPALRFNADVVMGSRFLAPRWVRVSYFWHKVGNRVITLWFNMLFNTTWTDVYSCYLMFRRGLVRPEDLKTLGWQQQAEILGTACLRGKRFYEVPISYNGRSYEEGKKIRWHHVAGVMFTMLWVRIFRHEAFSGN